jgi:uncharacterized protein YjeT (DUF2065 family)
MLAIALLTIIALLWAASGVMLIAVPSSFTDRVRRTFADPLPRFFMMQAAILIGLILVLGTSTHQASWLWFAIGGIAILKGMFFLGAPAKLREPILDWWCRWPQWSQRIYGGLVVALAALLAIDTIRGLS